MRCHSVVAATIGLVASMLYSLIIDWETVGGVALVVSSLFLVSVALVFVLEAVSASYVVKLAAFASPLIFVLATTVNAMWCDAQSIEDSGGCDGAGDVARFFLEAYVIGLAVAFVSVVALSRRAARRPERLSKR